MEWNWKSRGRSVKVGQYTEAECENGTGGMEEECESGTGDTEEECESGTGGVEEECESRRLVTLEYVKVDQKLWEERV